MRQRSETDLELGPNFGEQFVAGIEAELGGPSFIMVKPHVGEFIVRLPWAVIALTEVSDLGKENSQVAQSCIFNRRGVIKGDFTACGQELVRMIDTGRNQRHIPVFAEEKPPANLSLHYASCYPCHYSLFRYAEDAMKRFCRTKPDEEEEMEPQQHLLDLLPPELLTKLGENMEKNESLRSFQALLSTIQSLKRSSGRIIVGVPKELEFFPAAQKVSRETAGQNISFFEKHYFPRFNYRQIMEEVSASYLQSLLVLLRPLTN